MLNVSVRPKSIVGYSVRPYKCVQICLVNDFLLSGRIGFPGCLVRLPTQNFYMFVVLFLISCIFERILPNNKLRSVCRRILECATFAHHY